MPATVPCDSRPFSSVCGESGWRSKAVEHELLLEQQIVIGQFGKAN